jgi:UDP-N-acetyl-D-mannosaminuronic acid dehydrogenase
MKVCVIGLGEVGFPTAMYIKNKGIETYGYDINPVKVEKAVKEGITAFINWDDVPPANVYIICVSTSLRGNQPDLSPVFEVCKRISQKPGTLKLVSIESTIIPGTCRRIYNEIFNNRVHLIHVPHRYWSKDPINYGVKQLRVMGAINHESLELGLNLYQKILEIPIHVVSSIEIAELSKIVENAYRYVEIAFAEELRMICEELGLNYNEVRDACNTKWNVKILEARDGIGGHCLPKDIKYLISLTSYNILLNSAVKVDKQYRKWLSKVKNVNK